jgi:hypothetical protein
MTGAEDNPFYVAYLSTDNWRKLEAIRPKFLSNDIF